MATETYSLEQFVADLDRITDRESAPATAAAAASCSTARRASTSPR